MRSAGWFAAAAFFAASTLGLARSARADDSVYGTGSGFVYSFGLFGGYLDNPPGLTQFRTPHGFSYRGLEGQTLRSDSGAALIGMEVDGYYYTGTPLHFPLLGARVAYPMNTGLDRTLDDAGTPVRLHLENDGWYELLLPGVGFHVTTEPVLITAQLQPAIEVYSMKGTLTEGLVTADVGAKGVSFGVDAEVDVCPNVWWLSPNRAWLCFYDAPILWRSKSDESVPYNGMLFGVRIIADGDRSRYW
jgi:hypothetical protein